MHISLVHLLDISLGLCACFRSLTEYDREGDQYIKWYAENGIKNAVSSCETFTKGANMSRTHDFLRRYTSGKGFLWERWLEVSCALVVMKRDLVHI